MAYIVKKDEHVCTPANLPRVFPMEISDNIDGIAPKGLPIMSTCVVVEKMDVAVCNGRDQWYAGKCGNVKFINAGQPWSDLFAD